MDTAVSMILVEVSVSKYGEHLLLGSDHQVHEVVFEGARVRHTDLGLSRLTCSGSGPSFATLLSDRPGLIGAVQVPGTVISSFGARPARTVST